jgi:hypothetical protein
MRVLAAAKLPFRFKLHAAESARSFSPGAAGRNILYPNARLSTPNCIFQSRKQFKGGARAPDK